MNKYILIGIFLFAVLLAFASLDRKRNLAWCAAVRGRLDHLRGSDD